MRLLLNLAVLNRKTTNLITPEEYDRLEKVFTLDFSSKFLFSTAYQNVVKRYNLARRKDKNEPLITDVPFSKLIDEIQEEVIKIYKNTKQGEFVPNGFPIFNTPI